MLNITEVRIKKINKGDLLAAASICIDDCFIVKEINPSLHKISMRSKNIDVTAICEVFGGGGHTLAAGCVIKGSMKDAVKKILDEISKRKI